LISGVDNIRQPGTNEKAQLLEDASLYFNQKTNPVIDGDDIILVA
jgi:hypothetical protein